MPINWASIPSADNAPLAAATPVEPVNPAKPAGINWNSIPDQKGQAEKNYELMSGLKADEEARVQSLIRATGLPEPFVRSNPDTVQKWTQNPSGDFWVNLEKNHPGTYSWLSKPENMAVSHDDITGLADTEAALGKHGFIGQFWNSAMSAVAGSNAGVSRLPGMLVSALTYPGNALARAIGHPDWQTTTPEVLNNNPVTRYFDKAQKDFADNAPLLNTSFTAAMGKGDHITAGKAIAVQYVASMLPLMASLAAGNAAGVEAQLPAMLGRAGFKTITGGGMVLGAQSATHAANVNAEALKAGAEPAAAAGDAIMQGTIFAGAGELGALGPLRKWSQAIAENYGQSAAKQVMQQAFKAIGATLAEQGITGAGMTTGNMLAEASSGVHPEAFDNAGRKILEGTLGFAATGLTTTGPMAVLSGIRSGQHFNHTMTEIRRGNVALAEYAASDIKARMDRSALAQRSPEKYGEFVDENLKGTPLETIYIEPEGVTAAAEKAGMPPAVLADQLGLGMLYQSHLEGNTPIDLPYGSYLAATKRIEAATGFKLFQELSKYKTFDLETPTPNQVRILDERTTKDMEQAVKDAAPMVAKEEATALVTPEAVSLRAADRKAIETLYRQSDEPIIKEALANRYGENAGRIAEAAIEMQARLDSVSLERARQTRPELTVEQFYNERQRSRLEAGQATGEMKQEGGPDKALDWTAKFEKTSAPTFAEVKNHIKEIIANGTKYATISPDWFVDVKGGKRVWKKIVNAANHKKLPPAEWDRLNRYIGDLEELLGGAVYLHASPVEAGKKGKEHVEKYHYFNVTVKVGENRYNIVLDTEQHKGDSEVKPRTVHLYNITEANRKAPSGIHAERALQQPESAKDILADGTPKSKGPFDPFNPDTLKQAEPKKLTRDMFKTDREFIEATLKAHNIPTDLRELHKLIKADKTKKFWEQFSDPSKEVTPEEIKKLEAKTAEIPAPAPVADVFRGSYDPISRLRTLGPKADASTIIHEFIHDYFTQVNHLVKTGQADEITKADLATALKWAGADSKGILADIKKEADTATDGARAKELKKVLADLKKKGGAVYIRDHVELKGLEASNAMEREVVRQLHERIARGWEAYLREGKAPAKELSGVFEKFRTWLTEIYRSAAELGVELSADVRGVFDRMIAAEDEINRTEMDMGFNNGEITAALPADQALAIEKMQAELHTQALNEVAGRLLKELTPKYEAHVEEKRKEAEKDFTAMASDLPVRRVEKALQNTFPTRAPAEIAREIISGKAEGDVKSYFSALAEVENYSSADHLAKDLLAGPTLAEDVAARVANYMKQFEPAHKTERLRDWALEAASNEGRIEVMLMEREGLSALGGPSGNYRKVLESQRRNTMRIEARLARMAARRTFADKPVKSAGRYLAYISAEKAASVKVAMALADKDYARAAVYKRQEIANHALVIEAMRIRKQIDEATEHIHSIKVKKVDLFKDGKSFIQAAYLMERFGFGTHRDYNPALKEETLVDWAKRMAAAFGDVDENGNPLAGIIDIPEWIKTEQVTKPWQDLTTDQLFEVRDSLDNMLQAANKLDSFFALDQKMQVSEHAAELAAEMDKNITDDYSPHLNRAEDKDSNAYINSLRTPDTFFLRLDKFQDGGLFQRTFKDPVYHAANLEAARMREFKTAWKDIWSVMSKQEKEDFFTKQIYSEELRTSVTKSQIMAMLLNWGNAVNREKLTRNRPVGLPMEAVWHEGTAQELFRNHLDARDAAIVQKIWRSIDTIWPDLKKLNEDMTGFAPGKVEATPFTLELADGSRIPMEGGYFPLAVDPRSSERAAQREISAGALHLTEDNPTWKAATRQGASKARTQAQYPVLLDLGLITRHLSETTHDVYFRKLVYDLRRLVDNEVFANAAKRRLGRSGYDWLKNYVANIATKGNAVKLGTDSVSRAARYLNGRVTTALVIGKISIITQNLSNVYLAVGAHKDFTAADAFKAIVFRGMGDYWIKGTLNWKEAAQKREWIFSKSEFMRERRDNPEFTLDDWKSDWGGNVETATELLKSRWQNKGEILKNFPGFVGDSMNEVKQFTMALLGASDDLTNIPVWEEAYLKKINSGAAEAEAVLFADRLIERISPSGRKYNTARILRGTDMERLFSKLYTFWSVEYGNWSRNFGQYRQEPLSMNNSAAFGGFLVSRLLFAWTSAMLVGRLNPADVFNGDEDKQKDALKTMAVEALYPANFFPGWREGINAGINIAAGMPTSGYRPAPMFGLMETATRLGQAAAGGHTQQAFEQAAKLAAPLGFPKYDYLTKGLGPVFTQAYPDQFNTWIFNGYDWWQNGMEPEVMDFIKRRPKRKR